MSSNFQYLTPEILYQGRQIEYPLTPELEANAADLCEHVNKLMAMVGWPEIPLRISSGYRPGHYNTDAKGAKGSAHLVCKAVDIVDSDDSLDAFLNDNREFLMDCGLRLENPGETHTWSHLDRFDHMVGDKTNPNAWVFGAHMAPIAPGTGPKG